MRVPVYSDVTGLHLWRSIMKLSRACTSSLLSMASFAVAIALSSCSGGTTSTTTTTATGDTTYVAAYKALTWGSAATVTFPSTCTMSVSTTGVPPYHNAYYLAPTSTQYPTTVVYSPGSGTAYSVVPYTPAAITPSSGTFNICPTKASATTRTAGGTIGVVLNGEVLFNGGDGAGVSALSDQASYTFTSSGTSYTAYFIDQCNSHPTPLSGGYEWHHHGTPTCVAASVDGATGPSHIIGIALDGYPVYGGRDINGNVITTSQLDACNGITSATPEFPNGAYHYVLPIGVTSYASSMQCLTGTVSTTTLAEAQRIQCNMKAFKSGKGLQRAQPAKKQETMAGMGM
jgi:hypothetical protein